MKIPGSGFRNAAVALAAAGIALACASCGKSTPPPQPAAAPAEPLYQEIARVHWLGATKVLADTNSAYLAGVLALPEATDLLRQTLDKLAVSPWADLPASNRPPAEESSDLLRPLAEDLLREESLLRVRQSSNTPPEAALAIRLTPERQALWSTNLAALLQKITRHGALAQTNPPNWSLPWGSGSNHLTFTSGPDWAVVSLALQTSTLVTNTLAEARRGPSPEEKGSNFWISADLQLARLLPLLGARTPGGFLPNVSARIHGDGEYVRSRGDLKFPLPLPIQLEPWQIPTNFIREPLISFSAIQGFSNVLAKLPWVQNREISPVPNQLFVWALNLSDVHTFAAAPMTNSAAVIDRLGEQLEGEWNAWITNNALGFAEYSAPNHGLAWTALPLVTPALQALPSAVGDVMFGRLAPSLPPPGEHAPPELMSLVSSRTNTLYYGWEITEMRIKHWLFLSQSARMASLRAQLPQGATSLAFLQAAAPKLGNSVTEISLVDPATLSFTRKSHCGLIGVELHLLADWLESPMFPRGTYSTLAPPMPLLRWRAKTRSFEPTTNLSPVLRQP